MNEKNNNFLCFENKLSKVTEYSRYRIDSYFFKNISHAESFFKRTDIHWTKLGYLIGNISNGENLGTEWYSIDEDSNVIYLSVSQITPYGLENKNLHFLKPEILEHEFGKSKRKINQVTRDTIIITRSGTPGVALCSNHSSFDDELVYIPSGFVIVFDLKKEYNIKPETISFYLNLSPVRSYLIANSSGRCQRNISQDIIRDLPVPENLLENQDSIMELYDNIETKSVELVSKVKEIEGNLDKLWDETWDEFTNFIIKK